MRSATVQLYKIDELSPKAQSIAIKSWRASHKIDYAQWLASLTKFCDMFGIELCDWEFNREGVSIKTNIEYLKHGGIWRRIDEKYFTMFALESSYPLTGNDADESLLRPLRDLQENGERRRVVVLQDCLYSFHEYCTKKIEEQYTGSFALRNMQHNDCEFHVCGARYYGA